MNENKLMLWFSIISVIGMLWGILFAFYGLAILPAPNGVVVPWGNGVYGATLIGLSATLFFTGRHAFKKKDTELMKAVWYGICTWLVIEALFSLYYRVWFNVGVDIGIFLLLSIPLRRGMQLAKIQANV